MRTPPKYNYQVIKSHKSVFEHQVWEAVLINHEEADTVIPLIQTKSQIHNITSRDIEMIRL